MKNMLQMVLFQAGFENCEIERIADLYWQIFFQNGAQMEDDV